MTRTPSPNAAASASASAPVTGPGSVVVTTHLPAAEPFDFDRSLAFLASFPTMTGEHGVAGRSLTRAVREDGRLVAARLTAADPAEGPGLRCELHADGPLSEAETAALADRLAFSLGLDDDLTAFYALARDDAPFRAVTERLDGYHQVKFPSPFEMLCWAVLSQRVPLPVARGMKQSLVEACGNRVVLDGTAYWAFPGADQLLGFTQAEWAALVPNQRKAGYLHALVRHWLEIDEAFLRTGPYQEVRDRLLRIPGIGPWSASFVLIRGLGRMEELSPDKEVLRAAARVYGRAVGEEEFEVLADRYGPWRGYWGHYLRVSG